VTHFSTVEATPILGPGLVDHLPVISLKAIVGAIPGNVPRLSSKKKDEKTLPKHPL